MPTVRDQFEELSFERVDLPGGVEAYVRRFTWVTEDEVPLAQFQAHFVVGDRGYAATGTTFKDAAEIEAQLLQLAQAIAVRGSESSRPPE